MGEFAGAGKVPGVELWRIEKMVPVKTEFDGKLYSGDSYILLSTVQKGNSLAWNLHFWLGEETSQDEAGVAAYKTVELDESLGGGPIQFRETQGHESELFMTYFKKTGLEYLAGGVDSAFNKVERDVYRTRLLQCKGKRSVRVTEKKCEALSLNKGDVFILDLGLQIFLWNGADSNRYEKAKGAEMAQKINNERGAKGVITIMDDEPSNATFWTALGGQIEVTNAGEDDEAAGQAALADIKLLKIVDGGFEDTPRNEKGQFTRGLLDTNFAYILDGGDALYVWTGKKCPAAVKKECIPIATAHVAATGRPAFTAINRVVESGETAMFKGFFFNFDPPAVPKGFGPRTNTSVAAAAPEVDIGATANALRAAQQQEKVVDDGSGKLEIWRIENFKMVAVDPSKYGQFYGGDSYVLLYSYKDARKKDCFIIYFWQGNGSSADEKGASALLTKELSDKMGGAPTQVRVVQGKEPLHFRSLFKGSMIVHAGGKASGFKNVGDTDSFDDDGVSLFHVKGTSAVNVMAIQTGETSAALNSMDCFVLVTPANVFAWSGKGSNEDEKASAAKVAKALEAHSYGPPGSKAPERAYVEVAEGSEPDEFWAALGGKGPYAEAPEAEALPSEPRLFHITDKFGKFQAEEISNFTQEDMLDDDVMMLDVGTTVYLWVGSGASAGEKTKAIPLANDYVAGTTDGRDKDIPIVLVSSGNEPLLFTQFFAPWDPELFAKGAGFVDPYMAKLAAIAADKKAAAAIPADEPLEAKTRRLTISGGAAAAPAAAAAASAAAASGPSAVSAGGFLDPTTNVVPYSTLSTSLPAGVNPAFKEQYLSDAEFTAKLGLSKAEYDKLPAWKKKQKKESAKLF